MKKQNITIHDIAKVLNISASTVSRALQNHPRISDGMKKTVLEYAKTNNYQPNSIASNLRLGKGNTIGVILPRIDRFFFSSVIRGIEDIAYEEGYNVIICQSYDSTQKEKKIIENLVRTKVDGLLVSIALETTNFDHFQSVKDKNIPLIFFDRSSGFENDSKVVIDDYAGAYQATEHLIKQGCKRLIHFGGPRDISIYKNRYEGFSAALKAYQLNEITNPIFEKCTIRSEGETAANEILKMNPMPDGVFSAGDFSAIGAIKQLKSAGIRIPQDIAFVGFANEPNDDIFEPGLSSVDQKSSEMGRMAAHMFFEQVKNRNNIKPKTITLQPELFVRGSSLKKNFE